MENEDIKSVNRESKNYHFHCCFCCKSIMRQDKFRNHYHLHTNNRICKDIEQADRRRIFVAKLATKKITLYYSHLFQTRKHSKILPVKITKV